MTILSYTIFALVAMFSLFNAYVWFQARRMQGMTAPTQVAPGKHLYYFFSPRCGACKNVTPVVDRLSQRHGNVHKVDISLDTQQAAAFGVRATPTLMLIDEGRIARVMLGGKTERELDALLSA